MPTDNVFCFIVFVVLSICIVQYDGASQARAEYRNHKSQQLTDQQIIKLAKLSDVGHFNRVLDNILVPRVVGTPSHDKVQRYIASTMEELGWDVEVDTFQDNTPRFGPLMFSNVIARLNPNAKRYLALACHYDSKYFREGSFLGATDSAVPCAMMINLARVMVAQLDSMKNKTDLSLKLIFFDGEEAFVEWGPRDSIYGARHLATKWASEPGPAAGAANYLEAIDLIVLLDLLGARDPSFYSFFPGTESWYRLLTEAEQRLATLKQRTGYTVSRARQRYFHPMSTHAAVEDDHIPFLKRDVPILHVIPMPFPAVWHTPGDNRQAVDVPTVENLNKILRVFVAEYLQLAV